MPKSSSRNWNWNIMFLCKNPKSVIQYQLKHQRELKNWSRYYFSYILKIRTSILTILDIITIKTKNCVQEQNVSILHSTIIINLNRIIFISVLIYHKLVQLIATLYDWLCVTKVSVRPFLWVNFGNWVWPGNIIILIIKTLNKKLQSPGTIAYLQYLGKGKK